MKQSPQQAAGYQPVFQSLSRSRLRKIPLRDSRRSRRSSAAKQPSAGIILLTASSHFSDKSIFLRQISDLCEDLLCFLLVKNGRVIMQIDHGSFILNDKAVEIYMRCVGLCKR